jgi:ATP-dependent Lhr-like helicase
MSKDVLTRVGFHPIIKSWFKNQFEGPSPPQENGWPSIAAGDHTLILAPTGSGKTLAAFLWSIDQLFRNSLTTDSQEFAANRDGVHTLYISPLKALNNDIHQNLKTPLREILYRARKKDCETPPIRVAVRTGDTPSHVRRTMLQKPPHILITTPESFFLLLTAERGRELFRTLKYVIVDEIHAVSSNKRGVHLSLSLERLMTLCRKEPIRIGLSATQKPLTRIAAFLGGQSYNGPRNKAIPRPVNIVDCGQRKQLDLKVITPVETFNELPESSVWQPVYQRLYQLIRAHKTTLIFAGMRAQTEKIARALNQLHHQISGKEKSVIALAHHGSISREERYNIEARLKAGKIPAVIATASLELGIDIGSIDLVVNLEAPQSISGALQRVGRSGHLLSATSKGRIIVMYPSDLDDAVAIAGCMVQADIEETRIPQNALDILAQQIVAEVAVQTWDYEDLFLLVKKSYCYRNLTRSTFTHVVEMLDGHFSNIPLQALKARINWDRVNNRLIARRGSRLAAVMNGGTIPDRGYYGVYLENTNVKLGEVEEEFTFESRVGEVFFLGNSEWLIRQILQDRIIVRPVTAINPKAPFWKGGRRQRDYSTSIKIGKFRRRLIDQIDRAKAQDWLLQNGLADKNTVVNLVNYFVRQREKGQLIATDNRVVAELTIDSGGQPLLIVHATFGAKVNGAWAIAMSAFFDQKYHTQIQYSFDDDGILIRLPEITEPPPLNDLFELSSNQVEQHLINALPFAPVFLVHFRYNAARSLMLPRSQPGKRIPLWLQRLRAADLLQAISSQSEFPVVIETYRECLQDVFDLGALKKIIDSIKQGRIQLDIVPTAIPSPMAAGILFKFVSVHLYEEDLTRRPSEGPGISSEILNDLLETSQIPSILSTELISRAERRWQHLDPYFQAATTEDLFTIIEKLGPIDEQRLLRRCKKDTGPWLKELKAARRISSNAKRVKGKSLRVWQTSESKKAALAKGQGESIPQLIQQFLQVRGPVSFKEIKRHLSLEPGTISDVLERMHQDKHVVRGRLVEGLEEEQWCDRHNFAQLYRTAVARRRSVQNPADGITFNRFLLQWHGLSKPGQPLRDVIGRYRGYRFPLHFFEREILNTRYHSSNQSTFRERLAELDSRVADGDIIVHTGRGGKGGRKFVAFRLRGEGRLFNEKNTLLSLTKNLSSDGKTALDFLKENGASYGRDLESGTGITYPRLHLALQELAELGLVSCDNYSSFLSIFQSPFKRQADISEKVRSEALAPGWTPRNRRRSSSKVNRRRHSALSHSARSSRPKGSGSKGSSRADIRKMVNESSRIKDGRWFLVTSFGVMGKALDGKQRAEHQARLLLQRYGILVKEWYRREQGLLPWHPLFQELKRLEWRGEIRRGYFVSGLSGMQFALPEALEMLEKISRTPSSKDDAPLLLSSLDPALPYGGGMDRGLMDPEGNPLKVIRSASNHLALLDGEVILACENHFQRLLVLKDLSVSMWQEIIRAIKKYLKMPYPLKQGNRIEIHQINKLPAATGPFVEHLIDAGFEKDGDKLVLWSEV